MGAFVISKRFNGEFKFVFTSRKGKTIFTSLSYATQEKCEAAIELIKGTIEKSTYLKFKSSNGKYFFKLVIDEIELASSRKYTTELRLQKGINEIVQYASKAETLDFSSDDFIFSDLDIIEREI
ncbi:YegP family protein [Flavobacterium psychrotolerans]|uniref:DUF1508 domain-containing protein n=1 Tax=Flavobacterium psychrotolerans TaxID=2169410 RepID=A0A2U1JNY8_9FLAO|nr:DUF1508 domain-containing protein [Flavobacterium psychrotolerans]PWA06558.1 DUF1508 domain-containing protein [Flavobacterium psychrotolerans]